MMRKYCIYLIKEKYLFHFLCMFLLRTFPLKMFKKEKEFGSHVTVAVQ